MKRLWWALLLGVVVLAGCEKTIYRPVVVPAPCDTTEVEDDD